MYAAFQIELQEDLVFPKKTLFLESNNHENDTVLQYVKEELKSYLVGDGRLDAEKIKAGWFPKLPECHVFISHSHKDVSLAKKFSKYLYEYFGIISFIDSEVWGYSEELLRQLDSTYSKSDTDDNLYDYAKRNISTAHVHTLLTTALLQMIDSTECLIFLNTPNSITTKDILSDSTATTLSPWIYTEILASKIIKPRKSDNRPTLFNDSVSLEHRSLQIEYPFQTDHLMKISYEVHLKNLPNTRTGFDFLDSLYEQFENSRCL